MNLGVAFAPLIGAPDIVGGDRRRVPVFAAAVRVAQPRRRDPGAGARADRAGARQSVAHARGPRSAELGRRRRRRQEPEPEFRRPHAADRSGARRGGRAAAAAFPASKCASSKPARPTARPTARACSPRSARRSPTCRPIASPASIMITDGRVHDVPADAGALGFAAPVHALITGHKDERDRRVALIAAPRFGIVGQPQTITYRVEDQGANETTAEVTVRRDGDVIETAHRSGRRAAERRRFRSRTAARTSSRSRPRRFRRRTDAGQQSRRGLDRRRARQAARAAGLRRAACRRADLAQPSQIRRLGRSRAFHHSAAAGKAGRHADQRIVADRLSDARAVPAEDRTSSSSSSSTATRARACCRSSISTTSPATCATAARCWSRPAPIMRARPASGARRSTPSCRPSRAADVTEQAFRPRSPSSASAIR